MAFAEARHLLARAACCRHFAGPDAARARRFAGVRALLGAAHGATALSALSRIVRAQTVSLKIGIIGTGRIGGALAEHWAKAGHQLLISSRHPEHTET